jgi:hypothetical protein
VGESGRVKGVEVEEIAKGQILQSIGAVRMLQD